MQRPRRPRPLGQARPARHGAPPGQTGVRRRLITTLLPLSTRKEEVIHMTKMTDISATVIMINHQQATPLLHLLGPLVTLI